MTDQTIKFGIPECVPALAPQYVVAAGRSQHHSVVRALGAAREWTLHDPTEVLHVFSVARDSAYDQTAFGLVPRAAAQRFAPAA